MKILVVDDSEDIRSFLTVLLQENGFSVVEASNGLEAAGYFRHEIFDLIITDICMPGINGNILCKQFKLQKNQPVIALTGTPWLAVEDFDHVFAKPFGIKDLLDAIVSCFAISKEEPILHTLEKRISAISRS